MKLKITVHGVAYEVEVEVLDPGEGFPQVAPLPPIPNGHRAAPAAGPSPAAPPRPTAAPTPAPATGGAGSVSSPIAGTVVEIKCKPGENVTQGQLLVVIEAMKMNTSITSPTAGTVKAVPVAAGDAVREGQVLVELQ